MSEVKDNPGTRRFEMTGGGSTAILEYPRAGDRIVLVHTAAPQALSGQGVGCMPVRGALDAVRAMGSKVVPRCGFLAAYIERHPWI